MKQLRMFGYALGMSAITLITCVILADGILHMSSPVDVDNQVKIFGILIFWLFIIGIPFLFSFIVKWRYTIISLLFFFIMYFPLYVFLGSGIQYYFFNRGGFIALPVWCHALYMAVVLWGIQSIVFLICILIKPLFHKSNPNSTV